MIIPYLLINRTNLQSNILDSANAVALFLFGKDIVDYIIVKNESIVIKLNSVEVDKIEQELEHTHAPIE